MVIKVEGTRSAETLNGASRDREGLLEEPLESLFNDIFPNLGMCDWLTRMIQLIPEGRYTTFGSLALALGDAKAARAVGELISSGRVKGPVHRIVYSDGRVPERCMGPLSDEMGLAHRGSEAYVSRGPGPTSFEFEHPPLQSLKRVQTAHRGLLREEKVFRAKRTAGMDISPGKDSHTAVLVLLDLDGELLDEVSIRGQPGFPYISGYLMFREGPLILKLVGSAVEQGLIDERTLLVLDGNGILHPERFGIACHIGAVTNAHTCGAAKRLMLGSIGGDNRMRDGCELTDVTLGEERLGIAVRRRSVRPIFISRGHRSGLDGCLEALTPSWRYRVPEPTRLAHIRANELRRGSETVT